MVGFHDAKRSNVPYPIQFARVNLYIRRARARDNQCTLADHRLGGHRRDLLLRK